MLPEQAESGEAQLNSVIAHEVYKMLGKKRTAKKDAALLELLRNSLAEEEIRQVLTGALQSLDAAGFERLIGRLDPNTGETVQRVMASHKKGAPKSKPAPGRAKIRQEWDRVIGDWRDCLYESGDEEGKYVLQENHWEAPYLDTSAVTEDLEKIATRMRRMIPRVLENDIDPDFSLIDLAEETVKEVGSGLPEWMRCGGEEFGFGAEATGCLMEWAWQNACSTVTEEIPYTFIESIRELESSTGDIYLDGKAVVEFVLELDEERQREILSGIEENRTSPEWKAVLDSVHTGWFLLHKELLKRWSKSRHVEICRENIQKDWELALPVLEGLRKKKSIR